MNCKRAAHSIARGADAAGTLILDDSDNFSGAISGFDGNDVLQLSDILSDGAASLSYEANAEGTGGMLTASDGTTAAHITLLGQYEAAGFTLTSLAGVTGAVITYNPQDPSN